MKKFLTTLFLTASIIAQACWFTEGSYDKTYISSVNGKYFHYISGDISTVKFAHNFQVDLPLTVQIKVENRLIDEYDGTLEIKRAILQYKIERNGKTVKPFTTVKELVNKKYAQAMNIKTGSPITWKMNFASPVNLFGSGGKINIPNSQIQKGDVIIIRIYLDDGIYTNGNLSDDITSADIDNQITSGKNYQEASKIKIKNRWQAPHVFKVIYSGKRRLII
jgi:hypothetical protein